MQQNQNRALQASNSLRRRRRRRRLAATDERFIIGLSRNGVETQNAAAPSLCLQLPSNPLSLAICRDVPPQAFLPVLSLSDLAPAISAHAIAAGATSALDPATADRLLLVLRNAALTEAVLIRHPLVRDRSGLKCDGSACSKRAWCGMLRDLAGAAGVDASDAALLRPYLVCKECAKLERAQLCSTSSASDCAAAEDPLPSFSNFGATNSLQFLTSAPEQSPAPQPRAINLATWTRTGACAPRTSTTPRSVLKQTISCRLAAAAAPTSCAACATRRRCGSMRASGWCAVWLAAAGATPCAQRALVCLPVHAKLSLQSPMISA